MTPLIETIRKLTDDKKEKHIHPTHIMYIELLKEINKQVNDELNSLYKAGLISVIPTLNSKAIVVIDE